MPSVELGARRVGNGEPCLIAVEVGLNHNGRLDLAHRLIDAAADAGADAVKFQNYRTEDFIADRELTYAYESRGRRVEETMWAMFKRYELPDQAWPELRDHCEERDVLFFATPTGESSLRQLVELGVPLLKNGSDYLVHLPLIRAMAQTGIPTVLSTGMATQGEIHQAVEAFRDAGGAELVLLHCTSSYPTPAGEVNLRRIPELAQRYDCPVGLSDHTDGIVAAVGAVALGSSFLEKHFTLDRALEGPDHRFSADPQELQALVDAVRTVEQNLGSAHAGPTTSEELSRRDYRISCVAARSFPAGHRLAEGDVAFRRPGTGLAPGRMSDLLGRSLARDVAAGEPLTLELVR